eukprot:scaffold25065_cov129-Isochrysis_galbana.AAC.5
MYAQGFRVFGSNKYFGAETRWPRGNPRGRGGLLGTNTLMYTAHDAHAHPREKRRMTEKEGPRRGARAAGCGRRAHPATRHWRAAAVPAARVMRRELTREIWTGSGSAARSGLRGQKLALPGSTSSRAIAHGIMIFVLTKQSIRMPRQSRKPIWFRMGVEPSSSAPKARNMMTPATQMMLPV